MITDYRSLAEAVAEWLDRDDLAAFIPQFIVSGQRDLARGRTDLGFGPLRCAGNFKTATITISSETVQLPKRLVELVSWNLDTVGRPRLVYMPIEVLRQRPKITGRPRFFALGGTGDALVWPAPDTDYSSIMTYYEAFRVVSDVNLVRNGGFDTDTDWVKGAGWSISGGLARATAGTSSALVQDIIIETRTTYTLTYTLSVTSGVIHAGIACVPGAPRYTSGMYTEDITTEDTTGSLYFAKASDFVGTLDNVSVNIYHNWLTDNEPEVLLYAALLQAHPFLKNDERFMVWAAQLRDAVNSLSHGDRRRAGQGKTPQPVSGL